MCRIVQFNHSVVSNSVTPWTAACQAPLSFTISQSLLKFKSIEAVMLSNHLILCYPLFLSPSTISSTRVFSTESSLRIRWPKYWRFSFNITFQGIFSADFFFFFRIDWFDLLAVQETLKSLLQQHNSKAFYSSVLSHVVQLSYLYMTTGKTIALTI